MFVINNTSDIDLDIYCLDLRCFITIKGLKKTFFYDKRIFVFCYETILMLVNGYTAVTNNNTEDKNVSMGVPDKYYHNTKRLNLEYSIRKILIEFIFDNTKEFLKFVKINNSKMPKGTENLDHPRSCDWTVHFRIYYRSIIRVDLELVD